MREREVRLADYDLRHTGSDGLADILPAFDGHRRDKYLAQPVMLADGAGVTVMMALVAWRLDRRAIRKRIARQMCVPMFLD